jgi:hypothetical protein
MDMCRDSVFMYESRDLPGDLQVMEQISKKFGTTPEAATTFWQVSCSLEEAAKNIDTFKAKTCGSTYNLAVINLNMFAKGDELAFLLRPDVLGDPRTIFLCSLRTW